MTNNLNTYQLFVRDDLRSKKIANEIRTIIANSPHPITEIPHSSNITGNLIVAIGGDGTFLEAVSTIGFRKDKVFAGVNTGTLGFLQNISPEEFCTFIQFLTEKKEITTRKLFVPTITVITTKDDYKFHAINEVIIEGVHGQKISFSEFVNDDLYQKVSCNSVCVACSNGDAAFSMNAGGSIDFSNHFQLVRTLTTPIMNAAYERFISNPVICPNFKFEFDNRSNCEILIDGRLQIIDARIISVEVSLYGAQFIHKLELGTYSKVNTIRQKILGYTD